MQKFNKNGLFVKRVVGNDFSVGNAVVEGVRTSEDLAILNIPKEQMDILSYIVNGEGRNIPINEDGTFYTKIGHSYSVRYTDGLRLEEGYSTEEENFVIEKMGDGQLLFFAISEQCKINNPSYVVTEVFRFAALKDFIDWSGEGEPKWVKRLRGQLTALLDDSEFVLEWLPLENKLVLHTDRLDDDMLVTVDELLESVLLQNVEAMKYNHSIDIPWRDWPNGYTQIEYLESTGTQRMSFDPMYLPECYTEWDSQFTTLTERQFFGYASSSPYHGIDWNSLWRYYKANADLERHTFKMWIDVLGEEKIDLQIDDSNIATSSLYKFNGNSNRFDIFSVDGSYNCNLKSYGCKIWIKDELIHHYVTCVDEVGAPCIYDLVDKKAFYNVGTDDFLYPTKTTTYSLRRVLPDWGKLTETGLRRLYHTPANYQGELYDYALENGFKPIIESEKPEEGYWLSQWTETDDEIVLEWIETEPPTDLEAQN